MKLKKYYKQVYNKLIVWLKFSDLPGLSNEKCYKIMMDIFGLPELGISEKWKEEFRVYSSSFTEPISHWSNLADHVISFSATSKILMDQFVDEVYDEISIFAKDDPGFKDRIRKVIVSDFRELKITRNG